MNSVYRYDCQHEDLHFRISCPVVKTGLRNTYLKEGQYFQVLVFLKETLPAKA